MPPPPTAVCAASAAASASASACIPKQSNISSFPVISGPTRIPTIAASRTTSRMIKISTQVAITTDVSSSSSSLSDEELEAASKVGKRVKVKVPLKVYHVPKAPDLDLNGIEGVIKSYVGVWKGKRISANLPFKVEFFVSVEGQPKPVKFFAHLKEDEFEYLEDV